MPYQKSNRLPAEKASKLGHLEVIKCPLVQKLCQNFEDPEYTPEIMHASWQDLPKNGTELRIIFASDGSLQPIEAPQPPYKAIAFVKTALLKLDQYALAKIDKETPNPFALRDLMEQAALFHSTAFPLRHVLIKGKTIYNAVRGCLESQGTLGTDKQFTGQRLDSTGLYYYNARYYDPTIGRFISADSITQDISNPQYFSRYSYVLNNPLKYADPTGHVNVSEDDGGGGDLAPDPPIDNSGNSQSIDDIINDIEGLIGEGPQTPQEWADWVAFFSDLTSEGTDLIPNPYIAGISWLIDYCIGCDASVYGLIMTVVDAIGGQATFKDVLVTGILAGFSSIPGGIGMPFDLAQYVYDKTGLLPYEYNKLPKPKQ